jgi:NADP-dependent 3-hydroxy acid dehydrogenase YdfG
LRAGAPVGQGRREDIQRGAGVSVEARECAVVTGATSAIGQAGAAALAEAGYDLRLVGRDAARLEAAREALARSGARVEATLADLSRPGEAERAAREAAAGGAPPAALVHAAGLFDWASAACADPAAWDELVAVNLGAAMRLTRLFLPSMLARGRGVVVFIASMAGQGHFANNAAYVASKHGLVAFARSVFLEVRDAGVKVSAISPGLVEAGAALTLPPELHPNFLAPDDVADAVRYVLAASPRACPVEILLEPQRDPLRARAAAASGSAA